MRGVYRVTYNERIGQPYKTIEVEADNMMDAERVVYEQLGNVRIMSTQGPVRLL